MTNICKTGGGQTFQIGRGADISIREWGDRYQRVKAFSRADTQTDTQTHRHTEVHIEVVPI